MSLMVVVLLAGKPVTQLPIDRVTQAVVRAHGRPLVGQVIETGTAVRQDAWIEGDEQTILVQTLKKSSWGRRLALAIEGDETRPTFVDVLPPQDEANAAPKDVLRLIDAQKDRYGPESQRAEVIARETLPAADPLPPALASNDPLRVIEARLILRAGERRERLLGRRAGLSVAGSAVRSIRVVGEPRYAVGDDGSTLYARYGLTVALHLVRDENGILQEKDVRCAGDATILKRGAEWKLVDGSSYDIHPKSCR